MSGPRTTLKNILSFALAAGQSSAPTSHGLQIGGSAVTPDEIKSSIQDGSIEITSTDAFATNIVVTNHGIAAVTVKVMVEHWHSIERAFPQGTGAPFDALTPQPFIDGGGSVGPGGFGSWGMRMYDQPNVLNVYVDPINGSDVLNTGLSALSPWQTIQRVYEVMPWQYMGGARLQINLAGVGGFGANATAVATHTQGGLWVGGGGAAFSASVRFIGPSKVPLTLATGSNAPTLNVVPTTVVGQTDIADAAAGRTRFLFNAPGWTAHDMRGKKAFLRVTRAGRLVIYEIPISDNGVDRLWIDAPIAPGVILATDTVQIVTPGALIDGGVDNGNVVSIWGQGAGIGPFAEPATFNDVAFTDCYVQGDAMSFSGCAGSFVFQRGQHNVALVKVDDHFSIVRAAVGGMLVLDAAINPIDTIRGRVDLAVAGSTEVTDGRFAPLFGVGFYASPISGITTYGPCYVDLSNNVAGDSNTRFGIWSRVGGGQIRVAGGKRSTVTGTSGDMAIDVMAATLAVPYGVAAGQYEEVAGFNGNAFIVPTLGNGGFGRIFKAA